MTDANQALHQLWFTAPYEVAVRSSAHSSVPVDNVRVRTLCSAISAGTEMLVYRGQLPTELALDASIAEMQTSPVYPLQYGYASVGIVEAVGKGVDPQWLGKRVFSFAPHASHFFSASATLIELPLEIAAEDAVFLANMETAINLVQDGRPLIGERVAVIGQGIVGLLLTSVLARFPLADLLAVEGVATRRELAQQFGASRTCTPAQIDHGEADLIYEVSGVPEALNSAIDLAAYDSRIIVGSWYGNKSAAITLGGKAHRHRINISTSQVSTIAPQLSGRWTKARRFGVAWQMLQAIKPSRLITDRVSIHDAEHIYKQIHESPKEVVQAVFVYD